MGYYRPVSQFNIGKKSEHYSRKQFVLIDNKKFADKYGIKLPTSSSE
jgi:hypothetical protein